AAAAAADAQGDSSKQPAAKPHALHLVAAEATQTVAAATRNPDDLSPAGFLDSLEFVQVEAARHYAREGTQLLPFAAAAPGEEEEDPQRLQQEATGKPPEQQQQQQQQKQTDWRELLTQPESIRYAGIQETTQPPEASAAPTGAPLQQLQQQQQQQQFACMRLHGRVRLRLVKHAMLSRDGVGGSSLLGDLVASGSTSLERGIEILVGLLLQSAALSSSSSAALSCSSSSSAALPCLRMHTLLPVLQAAAVAPPEKA
ncbi:hypothetical protein ETH_00023150, partial [Eimeria tenella]